MTTTLEKELADFLGEPSAPPSPSTPSSPDPLSFLDGIAEDKPKSKRKIYPTFPDPDGTAAALAKRSRELSDAAEELKTNNKLLGELVLPFWMRHWSGKADTEAGTRVLCDIGPVLVICQARVTKMTSDKALAPVRHIIGNRQDDLFHSTFEIKIEGDDIPTTSAPALVTELKALFTRHGAGKALKVEKQFKPYPAFFTQRHVLFTPEQNMEINRAMPIVTQVKCKDIA